MSGYQAHRAAIHEKLVGLIGAEEADALMEMLPPERWTELAKKSDLDALRAETKEDLHREIASLALQTDLKLVATLVPSILVGVGLAFSAAKFS